MQEMFEAKKAEVRSGETREGMDLMGKMLLSTLLSNAYTRSGALVKGAGITQESLSASDPEKGGGPTGQLLTDGEILGNAFVFILAGHETAANTIHFALLFLAMNPESQKLLHKDIDALFGDRDCSTWDYDTDVPKLFGNMVGAVMNEELRLIPPVISIPKCTPKGSPQPLTIGGRRVIVPADCAVNLNTAAMHRNPKYWPTLCGPNATEAEIEKDLNTFKPERWLLKDDNNNKNNNNNTNTKLHPTSSTTASSKSDSARSSFDQDHENGDDIGGPQSADTSPTLLHPPKGAYIPFSEGYRACLGRRFAQVEVLAVLAVIFQTYSVELAVDEWADEAEVEKMRKDGDVEGLERVYALARQRAEYLLETGMGTIITLQLRRGKIPLKFVKRGAERFRFGARD